MKDSVRRVMRATNTRELIWGTRGRVYAQHGVPEELKARCEVWDEAHQFPARHGLVYRIRHEVGCVCGLL